MAWKLRVTPERERAIEAVVARLPQGAPGEIAVEQTRRLWAQNIVDALLALPDPVRDAAREVVEALNFYESTLTWAYRQEQLPLVLDACRQLRAALEKSDTGKGCPCVGTPDQEDCPHE